MNCTNPCTCLQHPDHEAFTPAFIASAELCAGAFAPAAQGRTRDDLDLPPHPVAARRLQLPSPADLFGLWRRGDRAFRTVGGGLDDAGAAAALPTLGHLRNRQCAAGETTGGAMVSAMEIRAMARRQRALSPPLGKTRIAAATGTRLRRPHWFVVSSGRDK